MGSLLIGLCSFGVRCIRSTTEHEERAKICIAHGIPSTVIISDVHSFEVRMLDKLFERRKIAAVLIGGGHPAKGSPARTRTEKAYRIAVPYRHS